MTDTAAPRATASATKVRPFYWSVRRELWEHSAVYAAPLIVAGLLLFGFLISTYWLVHAVRAATAARRLVRTMDTGSVDAFAAATVAAVRTSAAVGMPYMFVAGLVFAVATVVTLFYATGALYGERRDRTILFWKSLPVSDLTTVLAKVAVALAVMPAVVFAIVFPTQLVMLIWSCLILIANGVSPADLLGFLNFPYLWLALGRGVFIMALWYAPIACWLILVSGWAKRVAFLWAIGPWVAICLVEKLAFNSLNVFGFVMGRLAGGYMAAFTTDGRGGKEISRLADLNPLPVLSNLELWAGLAVAAACVAAAVRLRRYRDPI